MVSAFIVNTTIWVIHRTIPSCEYLVGGGIVKLKMSVITGLFIITAIGIASASDVQGEIEAKGLYSNIDYAYSVKVPDGVVGFQMPPPFPNHGFGFPVEKTGNLWVDASYDSLYWETPEAAAEASIRYLKKEAVAGVQEIERETTRLGSLPAVRLLLKYTDKKGTEMAEISIMAIRKSKYKDNGGIVYTIGARVPALQIEGVIPVIDKIIESFQLLPEP
jgi:hypothetical protein